ncbi:MAG: prepilin-type N-terminal cleavage/methylation domain-containing protein [Nitrospirae bacterium]|nr:MAG: prepilin-type N-terminal cleavage/methylation domain-containing protein [Nitrospirota bacterium]
MKKKQAGFSLVELMIVVAVIGIMSAFAALAYRSWTDKYNVERQTKEMYVDLMKARVNAMSRNRIHFVTFTATQYTIYEDDNPWPDGNGTLEADGAPPDDRTVMTKTLSTYAISVTGNATKEFNERGRANVGGSIYTTDRYGSAYDCVVIDDFRINMGKWNTTTTNCDAK